MPRGIPNRREALVMFKDMDTVPFEMRPPVGKGKTVASKGLPVVVLKQTAKTVKLQYTLPRRGRAKSTVRCIADFPVESVVLYDLEVVDLEVDSPAQKKTATTAKKRNGVNAAAKVTKKKATKKKATKKRVVRKRRVAKQETEEAAPKKRVVRKRKEYRKKRKVAADTSAVDADVVDAYEEEEAPRPKRRKIKRKKFAAASSSSRRKTSFVLDDED